MISRKIIYIRHGHDTRDKHKYDEILTSHGKKKVKELTKRLIDEHGIPDIIYYSPYYRTRQTKRIMLKVIYNHLKSENIEKELTKLKCDWRLSRFFTKKQRSFPDIRKETENRGAPIKEKWEDFKIRVNEQLEEMEQSDYQVIWCVTHTLVVNHVIKIKNIEHGYEIPYLDTVILTY